MTKSEKRSWLYSQEKEEIKRVDEADYYIYKLAATGHTVCEHRIRLGLDTPVELAFIADPHLNINSVEDEADEELYNTRRCRPH